mgnify:CR=1 FL=1
MLKVCKFGGSSLADASRFLRVREIVAGDAARRVVIVSAAGRRHAGDQKITDLLYLCHAHLRYGVSCWDLWRHVCDRYLAIRDGCRLRFPLERELEQIYGTFSAQTEQDWLASRGEYLAARLMAELLGFEFVDAAQWLQFDYSGQVRRADSYAKLASLADGRKIVTPGFYGTLPDGRIHTFSRGGSDITGALAAAALRADVYENWTDVPGILKADPGIVPNAAPIPQMSYEELGQLSQVGTQVLHESAVAPVREMQIPLQIRSTLRPELPGTVIRARRFVGEPDVVGFAGRRRMAMLRVGGVTGSVPEVLSALGMRPFCASQAIGQYTALLPMADGQALHGTSEALRAQLRPEQMELRENLSVLAAVCRSSAPIPDILRAVEGAGVPVHHVLRAAPALLMVVNDSQYETALRAAAAV